MTESGDTRSDGAPADGTLSGDAATAPDEPDARIGLPDQQEFSGQELTGLDLSETDFQDIEFDECTFTRCSFRYAKLLACEFTDTTFVDCDLSLAELTDTVFLDCVFVDCKITGVNWTKAQFPRIGTSMSFRGCTLNDSSFGEMDLRRWSFQSCVLRQVDFAEAVLIDCDFAGSDLGGATFNQTDLSGAQLQTAYGYEIDMSRNTVKGTYFSLPEASALLKPFEINLVEPTYLPDPTKRPRR